jgi:hypothetical protein
MRDCYLAHNDTGLKIEGPLVAGTTMYEVGNVICALTVDRPVVNMLSYSH